MTPDVSIVTIDNRTGAVKVILSGRNYGKDKLDLARSDGITEHADLARDEVVHRLLLCLVVAGIEATVAMAVVFGSAHADGVPMLALTKPSEWLRS